MKTKEDREIVELYWSRDENAIRETDVKYGRLCHYIANHILSSDEDCEECVNDTYFAVWNAIPPRRPLCWRFAVLPQGQWFLPRRW